MTTKKKNFPEEVKLDNEISETEKKMESCVKNGDTAGWLELRKKMHVLLSKKETLKWKNGKIGYQCGEEYKIPLKQ